MNFHQQIKNNHYFFKQIMAYSPSYIIAQAVVALINGLSPLIFILIPKLIIDELILGQNFNAVLYYITCLISLQLSTSILVEYISEKFINLKGHLYAMHFLLEINKKTVNLDMAQLDCADTHQKIALAKDIISKGIGMNLINGFFRWITSLVIILSTATIVISADYRLIVVVLLFSVLSIYLNFRNENWRMEQREHNIYLTRVLNYYITIMGDRNHAKEMRVFGFVNWLMDKYQSTLFSLRERLKKLYSKSLKIKTLQIISENLKSNGIYLFLAWKTFIGDITIGGFTQYFSATSRLSQAILDFLGFFTTIDISGKYIDSYRQFMEMESTISSTSCTDLIPDNETLKIKLNNVSFSYPNSEKLILDNINYTFESGKVYLIVGENGAGKTTLINLLTRLYDPVKGIFS